MSADTIARLKISLDDAKPAVLRRVEVPFDIRLDRLHLTIQAAMGWTNSHLYEIRAGNVGWSTPDPDADWASDFIDARKARLGDILEDIGTKTLAYLYDFGDGWEHTIKIEHLADPEPGVLYPRLIEVSGRCPPEDCGGPWGYAELLEAIKDPKHERHAELTEWIGYDFDPDADDAEGLKGSPRKLPPSPKLGLGIPPAKARDVANPRPSPDAYIGLAGSIVADHHRVAVRQRHAATLQVIPAASLATSIPASNWRYTQQLPARSSKSRHRLL